MRIRSIFLLLLLAWPSGLLAQERMMLADSAWMRGDHQRAFQIYQELLTRDSTDVTALHRMALVHAWEERYERSLSLLDRALEMAPDYTPAVVEKAHVLGLAGRYDEALSTVEPVLEEDPDNAEALEMKARVAFWAGRHSVSLAAYERLLLRTRDPEPHRLPYARVLVGLARPSDALREVERVLSRDPDNLEALELQAEIHAAAGRPSEALAAYDRLMAATPDPSPYRFPRALLLADLGRHEEALRELDRALQDAPRDVALLDAKARYAVRIEDYAQAEATYARLVELGADPTPHRLARARVLAWAGRYGEALDVVDEVLEGDPTNVEALEAKARYATWAGNYQESLSAYDRLIAASPDASEHLLPRARVLVSGERYEEAAEAFRRVLAEDPEDRDALIGLGQVLSWTGQFDSAKVVYERALTRNPDDDAALRGLAQVTTWDGDLREGERLWREALARDADDVEALLGLASNLRFQGRYMAARDALDRVEAIDPALPGLRDQRGQVSRALAPGINPSYTYVSDSDENSNHAFDVNGSIYVSDPLELTVAGSHKRLDQTNRPGLEQQTTTVAVGVIARLESGWALRGGVGVWQPETGDDQRFTTLTAGLSSPLWKPVRANLTVERGVYDVTALVAQSRVDVEELRLDGSVRFGERTALFANASGARFTGSEENTRILGGARLTVRLLPWLTTGPAARAFSYDKDLDDGYWDPEFYGIVELPVSVGPTTGPFLPRLEVAPGYQKNESQPEDPWNASIRVLGSVAYNVGQRRQVGVSATFANAGVAQISPTADDDYEYRSVSVFISWAF